MTYPVDDSGNVRVDFVWGNVPVQPDEQRGDNYDAYDYTLDGGWATKNKVGNEDLQTGWDTTTYNTGDGYQDQINRPRLEILDFGAHDIATTGYSNYPAYKENYAGDGDTAIETFAKVPNLAGLTTTAANAALAAAGFPLSLQVVNTTRIGATTVNDGKVESQSPLAGVESKTDIAIQVQTYNAPEVPNVVGLTETAAGAALVTAGLVKGVVTTSDNAGGATLLNNGLIKSATPAVGTTVNTGSSVALVKYLYTAP